MPCIQGFLTESLQRFRRTRVGYGFQDRWKIFIISLLQSVPNTFRKKSSSIDTMLESLAERLSKSLMIRVNGVFYFVRNIEDLTVLNPDFEPFVKLWFNPRRGEVFVDIGAHVGKYTVIVAKAVGEDGTVVALEPHPITFKALQNNIELNKLKNVVALNVAAWNRTEELNFHLGGSASEFSAQGDPEKGLIKVQATTMDELLIDNLKLQRVDWMKIDVEKAEIESLQGMKATLAKFKPKLLIEVWNRNLGSVRNLLKKSNYDTVAISNSLGPSSEWCVYLFCASTIINSD